MLTYKKLLLVLFINITYVLPVQAGDFSWLERLAVEAKADASGFKARLAARFNLGDVKVKAVIDDLGNGADAYMVMRLGEMSGHDVGYITEKYKENKSRGWGALARSLGIKPGSREFHRLKQGHDLTSGGHAKSHAKDKNKFKGNGNNKGKNKGKGKH